jgi:hypothetical protein
MRWRPTSVAPSWHSRCTPSARAETVLSYDRVVAMVRDILDIKDERKVVTVGPVERHKVA